MTFETFANSLIVAFIRHEFMQDEIRAAGIDLAKLPDRVLGKPTYLAYVEARKTKSHDAALFEVERDVSVLERFSEDMTVIPRMPDVLRDKFQELFEAYQFQELADKIRLNPEKGREIIKEFQLQEVRNVHSQTLSELSLIVGIHQALAKENKAVIGIKGFERLSEMIGGFNPERLGIFLGGTGFGKTNFAVNLTLKAAKTMTVGYVNMEMGYDDMVKRFAVIASGTSYHDYARGSFDVNHVQAALSEVGERIHLTSGRALSFSQIEAWARLLKSKDESFSFLVVDYDQKVDLNLKHQAEEWKALQKLIEAFEDLAKELKVYCMVLAQVNREGLISGSHRAQFPAHTVLAFYEHEDHGPIIEAKKNRHGKKNQALTVLYNSQNSQISELEVITLSKTKPQPERHKLVPYQGGNQWWAK